MVCTVCGEERPDKGTCRSCGHRLCPVCKAVIPLGRKNPYCSDCGKAKAMAWRLENPEKYREKYTRYREETPEKNRASCRKYREANQVKINAAARRWTQRNPTYHKEWYDRNRERVLNRQKLWAVANRDKTRESGRRHEAKKQGCIVSTADIRAVIDASGGVCAICRAFVPKEFRHIDHIIPLDKGGPHSTENLQLTCYRCNTSKGAKLPEQVEPETWVEKSNPLQPFLLNPNWK